MATIVLLAILGAILEVKTIGEAEMDTIAQVKRAAIAALRPPQRLPLSRWIERHQLLDRIPAGRCSLSRRLDPHGRMPRARSRLFVGQL